VASALQAGDRGVTQAAGGFGGKQGSQTGGFGQRHVLAIRTSRISSFGPTLKPVGRGAAAGVRAVDVGAGAPGRGLAMTR